MKNNISNERKRSYLRELGSPLKSVVSALLLVALLTQGLPMRALAEQVQANQVAQTNASEAPAANTPAADVPKPADNPTPAVDASGNGPANVDVAQEGDASQEGGNGQESGSSQENANAQGAGTKQDDASAQDDSTAQDGKTSQNADAQTNNAAAKDGKSDDKKDAATAKSANDAKSDQKSNETQKPANPAIDVRVESNGLIVKIYAPEGAFPAGTTAKVEPASKEQFMEAVDDLVDGKPVDARVVDISFTKDGKELEPANGHLVSVDLGATSPVGGDDFAAVHVRDNGSTEVMDGKANKQGASFKATDFSVYGIVGGTVIRGEDEQYTRIKAVFRNGGNDGAVLGTQIVRAGDSLVAPDVTPPRSGVTFRSWRAAGKDVDNAYLTSVLTEQDIEDMIGTYGATKDSEGENLWLITIASHFEEGYRAYFHWSEEDAEASDTIVGCLRTGVDGTVHLEDIQGTYKSPYDDLDPIGWVDDDGHEYALDATPTLTKDTHLYPEFPTGNWIKLDMGGAPALSDVLAQYNKETHKYDLQYDDLPNDILSDEYFYPGYVFAGWYLKKTGDTYEEQIAEGSTAELDDSQRTVYAKWTPSNNVLYTIVYLAEDSSSTPGNGKYYIADWEEKRGTTGQAIDKDAYDHHNIDYHHYCTAEENAALNAKNEEVEYVEGDGSTIKVVYYNSNRIRLVCNKDRYGNPINGGNSVLPSDPVKPGELLDDWLDDPAEKQLFSDYVEMALSGTKKYLEKKIDGVSTAIYSLSGRQDTIPYEATQYANDGDEYELRYYTDTVLSVVRSKYYYEALDDEAVAQAQADGKECKQEDVYGKTRWFILDHEIPWGTARGADMVPWEYFGSTYEDGGLVERAYRAAQTNSADDTGTLYQIPDDFGGPKTVDGAYRYSSYYYDHYFVRTLYDLKFENCENVSPQPTDTQLMFGTKLGNYLPNYDSTTTRVYRGATYVFDGWYSNRGAANNPADPDRDKFLVTAETPMPAQSTTLFAGWKPMTSTITFDAQGGTIVDKGDAENPTSVNAQTLVVQVESGQRIPIGERPNDVEREGYIFGGWYLDQNYTIPLDYDTFTSQSNTTIYARWVFGQKCKITYHKADGSVAPSQNNSFLAYSVVTLDGAPEATHDGLPFLGWSTQQGDVNKLVPNTFLIASDVDLYAVYGNVGYSGGPKVTLHANYPNSTEDMKTEPILVSPNTKNGEVKLPGYAEVEFKCPEGYRFVGWSQDQDGTGKVYAAGKPVAVDKDTDLYAVWTTAPEPGTLHQVVKDGNYGGAKVAQSDSAIAEAITLTDEELAAMDNGQNADFWIEVTDVTSTLDDETKNALHAVMDEGYTKGAYLNITAWVKVGDAEARQLHETKSALTVTFTLAADLKADGRSYEVSRSHDGNVTRVTSGYSDDQFTIDSDRFSYFEIAYKDGESPAANNQTKKTTTTSTPKASTASRTSTTSAKTTPKTGDSQSVVPVAVLLAAGTLVAAVGMRWRRRNERG